MFPLSSTAIFHLVLNAVWTIAALVVATPLKTRAKVICLTLMITLCVILPFALAEDDPTSRYDELGSAIVAVLLLVSLAIGTVWGFMARKILTWVVRLDGKDARARILPIIVFVVAVSPPLVYALYAIEREWVPDAACSQDSIVFNLGDRAFRVPANVGVWVELERGSDQYPLGLRYSLDRNRKADLVQLCRLSDGGQRAVPVDLIRFGAYKFDPVAEVQCGDTDTRHSKPPGCAAILRGTVGEINLSTAPPNLSAFLSWFDGPPRPNTVTGGDADTGYVCHKTEGGEHFKSCNVWMENAPGIYILARSHPFYRGTDAAADLLADVRDAVEFTFSVFEDAQR
jgi:hypothetical protein